MNYNQEVTNLGLPVLNHDRAVYRQHKRHQTTFNVGQIAPIFSTCLIQPGDTINMSLSSFLRLTTSLNASMDNLICEIYAFKTNLIDIYGHTKEFLGENTNGAWAQQISYDLPGIVISQSDVIDKNSILNHLGVPILNSGRTQPNDIWINRLEYNAYIFIYDEYFRDQNYEAPIAPNQLATLKADGDISYASLPQRDMLTASRRTDYFSRSIPEPQKGSVETLPLGTSAQTSVYGNGKALAMYGNSNNNIPVAFQVGAGEDRNYGGTPTKTGFSLSVYQHNSHDPVGTAGTEAYGTIVNDSLVGLLDSQTYGASGIVGTTDLSTAVAATIPSLRTFLVAQHIKEEMAIYGSRYREIKRGLWGVFDNKEDHIPEFLGMISFPLNMDTVLQTSSTDSVSPQGSAAGYSVTGNVQHLFVKSFTDWAVLTVVAVVRQQQHTYSQGLPCRLFKKQKYDLYWNEWAGIGPQPIYSKELYLMGDNTYDMSVIGYKQPWEEYRYEYDEVTGELSPNAPQSLDNWIYTDYYTTRPVISAQWMHETPDYVDRTLVVQSSVSHQLMADFEFEITKITEVPYFKLPGIERI